MKYRFGCLEEGLKCGQNPTQKEQLQRLNIPPKLMFGQGCSSMGTFPLSIFTDNMNSQMFIPILEGHLLTQAKVFHQNDWRLVMDNDPKHTSKVVKEFLSQNIPNHLPWPSQSPNLNPIENGFRMG